MKKTRRFLATLLTVMLVSMGTTAFAKEAQPQQPAVVENTTAEATPEIGVVPQANNDEGIMPLAASGYAAHYTDSATDSFYITVSGSGSLLGTTKLKAWDFPSGTEVYVSLYRPDGSAAVTNVKLPIGQEISKTFTNLQTGTYRLFYTVASVNKGWIYCNIN